MSLSEAIVNATSFSVCPTYSLFGVSSTGEYTLITSYKKAGVFGGSSYRQELTVYAQPIVDEFEKQAREYNYAGLEVRIDGRTVNFN